MDRLITAAEAADRLGTSVRFIRRLVAQRRIAYTKVGRHLRISTTDLDAFIAAGRVEATASAGESARALWTTTQTSSRATMGGQASRAAANADP